MDGKVAAIVGSDGDPARKRNGHALLPGEVSDRDAPVVVDYPSDKGAGAILRGCGAKPGGERELGPGEYGSRAGDGLEAGFCHGQRNLAGGDVGEGVTPVSSSHGVAAPGTGDRYGNVGQRFTCGIRYRSRDAPCRIA